MKYQTGARSNFLNSETLTSVDWQAEQLRCTSFLSPLFEVSAESAFRTFAGGEPANVSENRQRSLQEASGTFKSFKVTVVKTPGRIDMVLSSNEEPAPSAISILGPWAEMRTLFEEGVKRWIESQPKLQRLALGVVVLNEVKDGHAAGYKILNALLPKVDIDIEHSSDFFYQINRPRLVTFDEKLSLKINRLSKWSVMALFSQSLRLSPTGLAQKLSSADASVRFYLRAELDLSTDSEVLELPPAHLHAIWKQLVDLANELLLKGDIP
jgi:hypothetical protein